MSNPTRTDGSARNDTLLFGALWVLLCLQLAIHWKANPQYSFGWLVPPLAIYLFALRWRTRPPPADSQWRTARWALFSAAALFFPLWLLAQPSPDWRLVNWAMAAVVIVFGLSISAVAGGGRWMRHFAFPIVFIASAVPWPSAVEQPVVQGLMRLVAGITVETLNLFGIPALQHGNLIEIAPGLLGVDEACSGVRSLQATIMAALFLGELYRFNTARRIALLLAGFAIALTSNVSRTFLLAWNAARDGIHVVREWHDPAGFTILTVCFVALWLVSLLIGRGTAEPPVTSGAPSPQSIPRSAAIALWIWFIAVVVATEFWFYGSSRSDGSPWTLAAPAESRTLVIEPAAAAMLQADHTVAATWTDKRKRNWVMYFFQWRPGPSRSRLLARLHRPEHCLPAGGWRLVADRGLLTIDAEGIPLQFRSYTFEQKAQTAFVYFCLWQNRADARPAGAMFDDSTRLASIQAVVWRERRLGQQVAEFVLFGCKSAEEADAAFRETAPTLVRRHAQPVVPK